MRLNGLNGSNHDGDLFLDELTNEGELFLEELAYDDEFFLDELVNDGELSWMSQRRRILILSW